MTQITIRRLDPLVIDGLKKRATSAGHSMEEEVRNILSEAAHETALERQRLGLEKLLATRKAILAIAYFLIRAARYGGCAMNVRVISPS